MAQGDTGALGSDSPNRLVAYWRGGGTLAVDLVGDGREDVVDLVPEECQRYERHYHDESDDEGVLGETLP